MNTKTTKLTARFTSPVVVGEFVTGTSEGPGFTSTWDGIYDGVREDEGVDVHFFHDGQINGTKQGHHAIPVSHFATTKITAKKALTINASLRNQRLDIQLGTITAAEWLRNAASAEALGVTLANDLVTYRNTLKAV